MWPAGSSRPVGATHDLFAFSKARSPAGDVTGCYVVFKVLEVGCLQNLRTEKFRDFYHLLKIIFKKAIARKNPDNGF